MKPSDLLLAAAVIGGALWTYSIKHDAEDAADRVASLRRQIATEEERIVFLRADWAYLNAPARLERLVARYGATLKLRPVEAHQWIDPFDLPAPRVEVPSADKLREAGTVELTTGSVRPTVPRARPRLRTDGIVSPSRRRAADIPASIDDLLRDR